MEDAQLYVSANAMQRRDALLVLSEYLPQMAWSEEGENVLDIGCGSGDVTRNLLMPLLPRVEQVVGVDVSRDMVNFASKTFEHNSLSFRQLDIERAVQPRQVFPDGFSKVFSMYCLHWVKDQERCLTNIYQLLQPGGEALLVFLARNPLFTMYENMSMKECWQPYMQDPGSLPPHLAARRLRMRKVCAFLKTHSPLLRRRRLTTTLLSKLRWDISHHILYCPVPQVGLPWARYILGSVGVQSSSVTSNNVDVLLGRRLPSPSLEVLEVFALGDGVRVMVAQHPFTRLASAYLTLMEEANSTHTSKSPKGTKGGEHTHSQARVAVPTSFREFCRHVTHTIEQWVASPHLPPPDPRWMPVIYLCSPCTVNYTIISNVECFDSDVKFITDYCGLRGKARDALSGEQSSLQRPGHTEETRDPAEDDGVRCVEESKQESLLTEVIKEGRESYFSSISNRGMGGSVRALFNQLSEEEVDRLYRVYQHDFDLLQYRPL